MTANDNAIQQTLAALKRIVKQIQKQPSRETAQSLTTESQKLAAQFNSYSENKFTLEFYETASELVEAITYMRLNPQLQKNLLDMQLLATLNELVNSIRTAVYKHEALDGKIQATSQGSSTNPITAAQQRAEIAAQHSTETTAAAEKANAEGLKLLKEIQAQQRCGGSINDTLIQKSLDTTLTMYVKNTAAVLAADEAAAALVELKELIAKSKP